MGEGPGLLARPDAASPDAAGPEAAGPDAAGPDAAGADRAPLTDPEVEERLRRIEDLLGELEQAADPLAGRALAVVAALSEVYGTALARLMAIAGSDPDVASGAMADELLGHLLALHGIHPEPLPARVDRALEQVRPYLRSHGGQVQLTEIADGVARVRLKGTCQNCASSASTLQQLVTDAVLAAAPELAGVAAEPATPDDAGPPGGSGVLIPVESLLRPDHAPEGPAAAAPERCELCSEPLPASHRHLLDTGSRDLLCACQACTILFNRDAASQGHYRLIPDRRQRLPSLAPAGLGVPVGLAFFVRREDGAVMAHYPSPAGATQWEVDEERWAQASRDCPELADLAPDVEAVLVNTARGRSDAWLVPVDDCYRLVAAVRGEWEGISGGDRVWPEIERFFAELRRHDGTHPGR